MTRRNKAGLMRDYRAMVALFRSRDWLAARRRAVKSRREAWL